jgi:lipopolysaccharide transport system ATP-binding protein
MSKAAIKVQGLYKQYAMGEMAPAQTLYETIGAALRMRRSPQAMAAAESNLFWALKDLNFEIAQGEVVGVIGGNGAGKSTLLKILSRITAPTRGRLEIRGRVASLLEIGTGFHAELSGRENIYLNGAILGMTRSEVRRKFDEIVAFAEVEKFLDTPVKRYSSGMYVRLAFAVAANLDCDVLLVDEVLAVGDLNFQEKCLAKMGDISQHGRTVFLVSHNLGAIAKLCTRGLVMSKGTLLYDGETQQALATYSMAMRSKATGSAVVEGPLQAQAVVDSVHVNEQPNESKVVVSPLSEITLRARTVLKAPVAGFRIRLEFWSLGAMLFSIYDQEGGSDMDIGTIESRFTIPPMILAPGDIHVTAVAFSERTGTWVRVRHIAQFSVSTDWASRYEPNEGMGLLNMPMVGTRSILPETEVQSSVSDAL